MEVTHQLTSTDRSSNYDVIVIGGGPAGSTAAALVAESRHKVLVLEREHFPRFKIGESLMPGTYWTLKRLGVLDKMKQSGFPKKYSVQFYSRSGRPSAPFYFYENNPHESSKTWQVLRSEFDQMLLENAREKGADVRHGVSVLDVLFEDGKAVGVRARMPDKSVQEFVAKVIVDASGQSALLSRKLQMNHTEPKLKKASIYTHFEGGLRDEGVDEGATIIYHTQNQESWFWYIPLPRDTVSVGVVGSLDYLLQNRNEPPQKIFEDELEICPALRPRLANAEQLFPVKTTKDFSYRASQLAGDGWVLVGDAFGFVDPIYSSGVFLALKSGELAADSINEAFERDDFSGAQLGKFGRDFLQGMGAIRKLVYAFYSKEFSFGKFLKKFPECRNDIVNILIGNVFRQDVNGLFESMSEMCDLPEDYKLELN
ncbi:NAD(P)/FAD-dependent oxidoreductase [candidate division KSB1 bacterium]|nr:NAD(P)/FAD-dependent oxidoreductase [candidate division KSB1 bacterium]NIR69148.1 NAD(P)/FAD-dependent oxidoreductase [candidate division KSB1 bacterium]NIS25659.1 NAD(P)/FAD-dependent oxidoreductase [candidate division KSB1 bacterium]NIT72527.1 NAD(P)/FAD-dependent oxidoreductase [candidate division KSB1 bacterium]NIU26336.1 NAD(P)/FAD-dependent oxidoreductase [candidate division KSB1 bacterium]